MNYYSPALDQVTSILELMINNNATIFEGVPYTDKNDTTWYPITDAYPVAENVASYRVKEITGNPEDGYLRVYEVETFSTPVVPFQITVFQAKAILMEDGYLDTIEEYMNSSQATPLQKLAWKTATTFERSSPTVADIAQMLGLSDAEVDDMFIRADKFKA